MGRGLKKKLGVRMGDNKGGKANQNKGCIKRHMESYYFVTQLEHIR